jgi:hypothetical protein
MRVLLDECVPKRLRKELTTHSVRTVAEMGWSGIVNGKLLQRASAEFDCFLTVDRNLQFQQNLSVLPVAVVVIHATSNRLAALLPLMPAVRAVLDNLTLGQVTDVRF